MREAAVSVVDKDSDARACLLRSICAAMGSIRNVDISIVIDIKKNYLTFAPNAANDFNIRILIVQCPCLLTHRFLAYVCEITCSIVAKYLDRSPYVVQSSRSCRPNNNICITITIYITCGCVVEFGAAWSEGTYGETLNTPLSAGLLLLA